MTTAKIRFIVNKLLEKGGVINKVASRYVEAGYRVRIGFSREIDLYMVRRSERCGAKILWLKKTYSIEELNGFLEDCRKHGLKPIIILYGSGPHIDPESLSKLREDNVLVRRIR